MRQWDCPGPAQEVAPAQQTPNDWSPRPRSPRKLQAQLLVSSLSIIDRIFPLSGQCSRVTELPSKAFKQKNALFAKNRLCGRVNWGKCANRGIRELCLLAESRTNLMKTEIRILMVEDSTADACLMDRELRKGGLSFETRRIET